MIEDDRLPAEQRARVRIDAHRDSAGWAVQDRRSMNLFAQSGVAREVVLAAGHGRVDDLPYVDRPVVGVVEAKPEGTSLSGVEWQSAMYATGLPEDHRRRAHVHRGGSSLEDADDLPAREVLAREIVDDLEAALAEFSAVAEALEKAASERGAPG